MVQKGEMYWYRSQKETYGFIVLENQKGMYGFNDFLIAISEKLDFIGKEPKSQDVLFASLYTLAWFWHDSILPERRIHYITQIPLADSFINVAGIFEDEKGSYSLSNIGHSEMWRHEYRRMVLPGALMKDVLSVQNIPGTIDDNTIWRVSSKYCDEQNNEECKSNKEGKRIAVRDNPLFSYQKGERVFFSPEETSKNIWIDIDEEVTRDDRTMKYVVGMLDDLESVLNKAKAYLREILMDKDNKNYETVNDFLDFHRICFNSCEINHVEKESTISLTDMIECLKIERLACYKEYHSKQPLIDLDLYVTPEKTDERLMLTLTSKGEIISVQHES